MTVVSALTFAVETVVPSVLGVAFLGDRPRPGMGPLAVVGFVVTLVGAVLLARYAEPDTGTSAAGTPSAVTHEREPGSF